MQPESNTAGKPTIEAERVLAQGRHFAFTELDIRSRRGTTHTNQIVRHPGAVAMVPLLERPGEVSMIVFVDNYRAAVDRRLLELPAGKLEAGEDPTEAAGRELIEETGYRASQIEPLDEFLTSPGLSDERMHAFIATGLVHVGQNLEEDEDLLVREVPVGHAVEMARDGSIEDAKSALAILIAHARGLLDRALAGDRS